MSTVIKRGLGKGLGALLSDYENETISAKELDINDITPSRGQPRKKFDSTDIESLAQSMTDHGVIQPILVRKDGNTYKIVAGERRWRAARVAGFKKIPAIVKDLSEQHAMEISIIENLQRVDLDPIETAQAYARLIEDYDMDQEEVATKVGKSRPAITNMLRLLTLPDAIKEYVKSGQISSGHARALVPVEDTELQLEIANKIVEKGLSVRDVEKLIKSYPTVKKPVLEDPDKNAEVIYLEDRLRAILGTRVKLMNQNKKGKIMIEYYSTEELNRIVELIYSAEQNGK